MDGEYSHRMMLILRIKLWPTWRALHMLSWVPLWWLRKYVPTHCMRWTPAATIRAMSKHIKTVEETRDRYWQNWHNLEESERKTRMNAFGKTMTPALRKFFNNVYGVEF